MQLRHQRIAAIARSVDGLGVGFYSLIAAVLPGEEGSRNNSGAAGWRDAINRNDNLPETERQVVPTDSYMGKIEGRNQDKTHIVLFEHVPAVVKFVLKNPIEFFKDADTFNALAELVGNVEAVESVASPFREVVSVAV